MRANEIMRGVLDMLNRIECGLPMPASMPQSTTINMISIPAQPAAAPSPVAPSPIEPVIMDVEPEVVPVEDDESRRFKQIMDILVTKNQQGKYSNSPNETVTGFNSVTTDAGLQGVHPADIRADSAAMYPHLSVRN